MTIVDFSIDDFNKAKNQNNLNDAQLAKILETYHNRQEIEKYSHLATIEEIKENEYNLNIPRYVDTFEEEEIIDLDATKTNIARLETEIADIKVKMNNYLAELGL